MIVSCLWSLGNFFLGAIYPVFSFYHFLRANGTHFPEPKSEKRPTSNNPDAVDSQKEADDLAIALQLSLQEEESKKQSAKVWFSNKIWLQ